MGAAPALAPALLSCEWMSYHGCFAAPGLLALLLVAPLSAADPDRDFSGRWTLDTGNSHFQVLDTPVEPAFTIVQQDAAIHSSTNASYALDGSETRYRVGDTSCRSDISFTPAELRW